MKKNILIASILLGTITAFAQQETDKIRSEGFPAFPKIKNTIIPGAPILGQPILIDGTEQEIRTEKHGLAYPALYDWNHDGKTDLLVGEFETGATGSNIKVYLNTGSNKKPRYTGKYFYATDTKGDTITNNQWCCIGIHPRFVDLDNDGILDIASGQYNPGLISWWKGTNKGFEARQYIPQRGYHENIQPSIFIPNQLDTLALSYWNYSSAGFADFNGDGLNDLFVGGFENMRVAINEGTAQKPAFGLRNYLLGVDGLPLSMVEPSDAEIDIANKRFIMPNYGGLVKGFVTPVDWDGDGVLDLLVTDAYRNNKAKGVIVFFRGVDTDKGLRFEAGKPLFTTEQVKKTFPGCQPNIAIADYNHDGVMDVLIGISLPTVNGYQIDSKFMWSYLDDLGVESPGKDAGEVVAWSGGLENVKKRFAEDPLLRNVFLGKLGDEKYFTLRHRGYVYVMLGKKNQQKAIPTPRMNAKDELIVLNETKRYSQQGPVSYEIKAPAAIDRNNHNATIEVIMTFKDGWHGYTASDVNKSMGIIPTDVIIELPDGFKAKDKMRMPVPHPHATYEVYEGENVKFSLPFGIGITKDKKNLKPGTYPVKVTIKYQVCNEEMCLPPVTELTELKINFN